MIKYTLIASITLEEFALIHGLTMTVRERQVDGRYIKNDARFYASFDDCEIKEGSTLQGAYGNGETPEKAIINYANTLRGKTLVYAAYKPYRKDIKCPNEWKEI